MHSDSGGWRRQASGGHIMEPQGGGSLARSRRATKCIDMHLDSGGCEASRGWHRRGEQGHITEPQGGGGLAQSGQATKYINER
jgi:hypothetical protein